MAKSNAIRSPADTVISEHLADRGRRQNTRRKALHRAESLGARAISRNDLSPKLVVVDRALADLKMSGRKFRPSDPAHVAEIATSIRLFGMCAPLLVRGDEIIDGQVRAEAATSLGLKTIACVEVGHLSVEEARQLRLAANRLSEKGTWDVQELKLELEELQLLEAPIELLGFGTPELDLILMPDEESASQDAEDLTPAEAPPVTRPGDLWVMGEHRVLCADARDRESYTTLMAGEEAQLVCTDPPYNCAIAGHVSSTGKHREFAAASGEMTPEEFQAFLDVVFVLAAAVLKAGGILASFMDWRQVAKVLAAGAAAGLELLNIIVWAKTAGGMGSLWRSQHELLPVFKKPGAHINNVELGVHGRYRSNVWSYAGANSTGSDARKMLDEHPTPKPVAMLADALLDVTNLGDVVLDPFLGSGSTLMAAEATGRRARGLELDPVYVDVILRRWVRSGGAEPTLEATGRTFSKVAQERARAPDGDLPDDAQTPPAVR